MPRRPKQVALPTIQEEFFRIYHETRPDYTQQARFDEAFQKFCKEKGVHPPFKNLYAFKRAMTYYKSGRYF
jgi:hypothetical protein